MTEKVINSTRKRTRGPDGRFQPNRSVRLEEQPKKQFDLVQRCRDMTPEALDMIGLVLRDGKEAEQLKAAGMILAYGWGRAPQTVNLNHSGEAGVSLFDPEKRQEIIDAVFERLRASGAGTGQLRQ